LIAIEEMTLVYESMKVAPGESLLGTAISAAASVLG
jgi:hypothetical protein